MLFQTREQAVEANLTFLNSAGNYIIKVDNTTSGANDPTFGRPSVKVLSNYTFGENSLIIMDAVHMPFGVRPLQFMLDNPQSCVLTRVLLVFGAVFRYARSHCACPGNDVLTTCLCPKVWPAFWSEGPVWPDDGEIDIIEGVSATIPTLSLSRSKVELFLKLPSGTCPL